MPEPDTIVVAEPIAPIVAVPAILGLACLGFKCASVWAKAEVAAVNLDGSSLLRFRPADNTNGVHFTAAVAISAVEPVIQTVIEAIHAMLLVAFSETGEQHFFYIGFAVAISVFRIKDFRRGADDDPFAPGNYSVWKVQAIEEDRGFIVDAVIIRIFEKAHNAA